MAQSNKAGSIELRCFVENFKFARGELGLTQGAIERTTKITQEFISQLEASLNSIGIDAMSELSEGVQIPLHILVDPSFKATFDFSKRLATWDAYLKKRPSCSDGSSERLIFGQNFKLIRESIKLTQRDIEERTGFPQTKLTQLERGKIGSELTTLVNLSRAVGKNLSFLLKP